MNNQLTTYNIPINPNITKGRIYTLYINNNTNLDITSILNVQTINLNQALPTKSQSTITQSTITMSKEDYTRLLELNNLAYHLTTKRTEDIQKFIQAETKTTTELSKINAERGELIKKLTKGSEKKDE